MDMPTAHGPRLSRRAILQTTASAALGAAATTVLPGPTWAASARPPTSGSAAVSSAQDADALFRVLDAKIEAAMAEHQIPGVAVGVYYQGQEYVRGYGVTNVDYQQPVDGDTLFRIGSISKVFTAEAVVQLADRGQIDLDADVNRYLKRVKVPATFAEPVTAAHLLAHTAGFDEIRPGTQAPDQGSVLSLPDFLAPRLVRLWRPGRIPAYSTWR